MKYTVNLLEAAVDPGEWARRPRSRGLGRALGRRPRLHRRAGRTPTSGSPPPRWRWPPRASRSRPRSSTTCCAARSKSPRQPSSSRSSATAGSNSASAPAGPTRRSPGRGCATRHPANAPGMFAESAQIVRSLLHERCVHVPRRALRHRGAQGSARPMDAPPLLVGSVGGPRTIREVTPHLDRVEIKAQSAATRNGALDLDVMATIPDDAPARPDRPGPCGAPDIETHMFCLFSVGDDAATERLAAMMPSGGLFRRFFGAARRGRRGACLAGVDRHRSALAQPDDRPHSLERSRRSCSAWKRPPVMRPNRTDAVHRHRTDGLRVRLRDRSRATGRGIASIFVGRPPTSSSTTSRTTAAPRPG